MYLFVYSLLVFVGMVFFSPKTAFANSLIFEDNFNDGDTSDWTIVRNTCSSNWIASNLQYGINIVSPCITEAIPDLLVIPTNQEYNFEVDMTMVGTINADRNFVFKYLDSNNWYGIHTVGTDVYLHKVVNGVEYFLANWHTNFQFSDNQTYHFLVNVKPTGFEIYINGFLQTIVPEAGNSFTSTKAGLQASSGGIVTSQVLFDNVKVTTVSPEPSPTPSPSATPEPIIGKFELPFNYVGRPATSNVIFKSAFWDRVTGLFDHTVTSGVFTPYTGSSYTNCTSPLSCYDSHNGIDFSVNQDGEVYSVAKGKVVYASLHSDSVCYPETTFGCVVIAKYQGNIYVIYAHLSKIFINPLEEVNMYTKIGKMGKTGCDDCNEHLHLGVLIPLHGPKDSLLANLMSNNDWKTLISEIGVYTNNSQSFCSYRAPNGTIFNFTDPLGWSGSYKDPWSLNQKQGGCQINSKYLWRYPVGNNPFLQ